MSRLNAYASPPPPHTSSELHAYIGQLEDEILKMGGSLPTHRPLILGPFRERVREKSAWKSFTAGACAAMLGGSAVHPIDVIKVRQQLFGMKDGFGVGSSWVAKRRTTSFFAVSASLVKEEVRLPPPIRIDAWREMCSPVPTRLQRAPKLWSCSI